MSRNFQMFLCVIPIVLTQIWKSVELLEEKGLELSNHISKYKTENRDIPFQNRKENVCTRCN